MQDHNERSEIPEYVDDQDLARLTPISRAQWQAYRQKGGGPKWRKVSRRVVYKWSEVVAWLDSQPVGG